jgi:Fe-S cluster biogenesis protein NfuA
MVNRSLFAGHSWLFSNFEEAAGSPLAESVFSVDSVETLLLHDSTAVVTKTGGKGLSDWEALAKEVGGAMRETLNSGTELVSQEIIKTIPSEEVVREEIQKVIDTEVNPGVAGHGGRITLTAITGNTVTIEMGGGCQGCSAADLTLKQGIHSSFRKAVPYVGAIYDETDHAAGSNPYYR